MNIYLSVVLACFNEAEHLASSYPILLKALRKINKPFEIIFVEDSSRDNTLEIIHRLIRKYPDIKTTLIIHRQNLGRGKSVTDGFTKAQGLYVGYIDADLEIDPLYIKPALQKLNQYDGIVGRRHYFFKFLLLHRFIATKIYALFVKMLFRLPVSDTESGFKFFERNAILKLLEVTRAHGWFWDTEVIANAHQLGFAVAEIPSLFIRTPQMGSTVRLLRDSLQQFTQLMHYVRRAGIHRLRRPCCH